MIDYNAGQPFFGSLARGTGQRRSRPRGELDGGRTVDRWLPMIVPAEMNFCQSSA